MTLRSVTRKTVGISEKVSWPTAALVAVGGVLAVLDALGVIDVEDELYLALLGAAGTTGVIGYSAPAPVTTAEVNGDPHRPVGE